MFSSMYVHIVNNLHFDVPTPDPFCLQKRKADKNRDPSASVDPTSMTLSDLIWHAHAQASAKEEEYQKALAEKKKREAVEAQKKKQQAQNRAAENLPESPAKPSPEPDGASFAPRLVMRNGQIVVDEQSLTIQVRDHVTVACIGTLASLASCPVLLTYCALDADTKENSATA
jgi:hypothetical protein